MTPSGRIRIFCATLLLGSAAVCAGDEPAPPLDGDADLAIHVDSIVHPARALVAGRAALAQRSPPPTVESERELLWWMGWAAERLPDPDALTTVVNRLRGLAERRGDRLAAAYADLLRAGEMFDRGDGLHGLEQTLRTAGTISETLGPRASAVVELQLCDAFTMAGQAQAALSHCDASSAAWRALGDPVERGRALNIDGIARLAVKDYGTAVDRFSEARGVFQSLGSVELTHMVGDNLAAAYTNLGRPEEALELSRTSLGDELRDGRVVHAIASRRNIADALHRLGRDDEALDAAEAAIADCWTTGALRNLPPLLTLQADILTALGHGKAAESARQQARVLSAHAHADQPVTVADDIEAHYGERTNALRVAELERTGRQRERELSESRSSVARQESGLIVAAVVTAGLAVVVLLLLLLWRTQRRHARALQRLAYTDSMTGLPNRRATLEVCHDEVQRALRENSTFGLLILDIDHFKRINDTHGHVVGDSVIREVGRALDAQRRRHDLVGRIGGEEFAVVLTSCVSVEAARVAERLHAAAAAVRVRAHGSSICVTMSGGLAMFPGDGLDWDQLLAVADRRLYAAKDAGRNQIVTGGPEPGAANDAEIGRAGSQPA